MRSGVVHDESDEQRRVKRKEEEEGGRLSSTTGAGRVETEEPQGGMESEEGRELRKCLYRGTRNALM